MRYKFGFVRTCVRATVCSCMPPFSTSVKDINSNQGNFELQKIIKEYTNVAVQLFLIGTYIWLNMD